MSVPKNANRSSLCFFAGEWLTWTRQIKENHEMILRKWDAYATIGSKKTGNASESCPEILFWEKLLKKVLRKWSTPFAVKHIKRVMIIRVFLWFRLEKWWVPRLRAWPGGFRNTGNPIIPSLLKREIIIIITANKNRSLGPGQQVHMNHTRARPRLQRNCKFFQRPGQLPWI